MTATLHDLLKSYREGGVFPSYDQLAEIAGQDQGGAAVRVEAVAVPDGWKMVPLDATWEMTRPAFSFDIWRVRCDCGQEHSGGLSHNKAAQLFKSMVEAAPVSARAADAPSEPSERETLLEEFYRASTAWENTCGHPDATADDERKAEERFIAAGRAMRELPVAAPMVADPAGVALSARYEKYMEWCERSGYDALTWPEFVDSRKNSGQRHHAPITYGVAATVKAVPSEAVDIPKDFAWPSPPPSKGQSHVMFDDGYEEGWAKAIDTVRAQLADNMSDPAGVALSDFSMDMVGRRLRQILDLDPGALSAQWHAADALYYLTGDEAFAIRADSLPLAATVKAVPSEALDEAAAYRMWRDYDIADDAWFMQHLCEYLPSDRAPTAVEFDAAMARVMQDRAPLADKTGGGE